jgi:hypothetical protein
MILGVAAAIVFFLLNWLTRFRVVRVAHDDSNKNDCEEQTLNNLESKEDVSRPAIREEALVKLSNLFRSAEPSTEIAYVWCDLCIVHLPGHQLKRKTSSESYCSSDYH